MNESIHFVWSCDHKLGFKTFSVNICTHMDSNEAGNRGTVRYLKKKTSKQQQGSKSLDSWYHEPQKKEKKTTKKNKP